MLYQTTQTHRLNTMKYNILCILILLANTLLAQPIQTKPKTTTQTSKPTTAKKLTLVTSLTGVQKDSADVWFHTRVTYPCDYMSEQERAVIQQLNIARMYPKWYLYFYLKNPQTENEKSLYKTMMIMKSIPSPLVPCKACYESALCHAKTSGEKGYVGHDRQVSTCKQTFNGECCEYGSTQAKDIILNLLIDEDVPSLGHRIICLTESYTQIGISTQPHSTYRFNTVLDFIN